MKKLEKPSFYKVTYLGGSTETICAKTPKDAYKIGAQKALLNSPRNYKRKVILSLNGQYIACWLHRNTA